MFATTVRALACAAFLTASSAAAFAQNAGAPSPEPSEIVHVTTSDRQDEPISRTSRPTYVVDRATIAANGWRTVADALQMIPGVTLFRYGAYGAQVNYGVLGATSEQTLVLLNGFPVAAASSGSIDLGSFSTAGVDRIEIVEGGGSTLYGSSAVGGIINIITGRAPSIPYAAVSTGTLAERDARFDLGAKGFSLAFERHLASNAYSYPSLDGFAAGTRSNAQAGATAGRIDYHSNPAAHLTLDAAFGNNAATVGVPGGLSFLTPHAIQGTSQLDGHFTVTRRGERSAFSVSLSGAQQRLTYNDPDNGGESDTYDARGGISVRDVVGGERASLVSGIDLSRETALINAGAFSTPPIASAALSQSAVYAQYRDAISRTAAITFGLRGEHDAPQASVLVPTFGTRIDFGSVRFAANYAGTFRVPTIDELYFPGFANPSLVPERSRNLDFTVSVPVNGGGSASLGWFSRQAVNLIALDVNFIPQNISRASLAGFVFSGKTAPFHGFVASLGLTNLYRALDQTPGQPQIRLDFEPVLTTTLGLEKAFHNDGYAFGINARVSTPHVEGAGAVRDGATTVDAYLRARLAPQMIATVRARNLGGERFAPILGYPAPGRTIEFELATR